MDLMLSDKRVLITGASQGIGQGLAEVFAEEGVHLHLVARQVEKMNALAFRLQRDFGVDVTVQGVDLAQIDVAQKIADAAGDTDILVNNAEAIPPADLWQVDEENWRRGWDVKVMGYIDMTRLFYARMKGQGHGLILNNIGNGGENFHARYIAGNTGNAALMAFTRAIGGSSLDDNIRVIGVTPGPIATDRIVKVMKLRAAEQFGDESRYEELFANYPLGRVAKVREIVDLFAFLASSRSGYTSGTIVPADGGITSRRSIGG